MKKETNLIAILVLSDGDTWETLGAQSVLVVSETQLNELNEGRVRVKELNPLTRINVLDLNKEKS